MMKPSNLIFPANPFAIVVAGQHTEWNHTLNPLAKPCSTALSRFPRGSQAGAVPMASLLMFQFLVSKYSVH